MYRVYAHDRAGAHQPRHPPPARAAARQRPPPHRADERAAVLAARHAGPLLRRRDRHGRQHLPRRPQRRAHADAVERATATPASRAPTRSGSTCRSSSTPSTTTRRVNVEAQQNNPHSLLLVDEAPDRAAQALQGVRPRHARVPDARATARCSPSSAATRTSTSWSSPTCRASCSTSSSTCPRSTGTVAGRAVRPHAVPAHRRPALPPDARAARLLLVRASPAQSAGARRAQHRAADGVGAGPTPAHPSTRSCGRPATGARSSTATSGRRSSRRS